VRAICSFTAKLLRSDVLYGHFVTTWTPVRVSRGATLSDKVGRERNLKAHNNKSCSTFRYNPPSPHMLHRVHDVPDAICKVCQLRANSGMHRATLPSSLFAIRRPLHSTVSGRKCSRQMRCGLWTVLRDRQCSCCSYRNTTGLRTVMPCCTYRATWSEDCNVMLHLPCYHWSEDCNVMLHLPCYHWSHSPHKSKDCTMPNGQTDTSSVELHWT
jgi:hypothetical protein